MSLKEQLLAMMKEDLETRERLVKSGELYQGYNAEMEAVHNKNAAQLEKIIEIHGWPGIDLVGKEGAEAAWLIVQHAIGWPTLQRKVLRQLQGREKESGVSPAMIAALQDRIRVFEGKNQIFGTNFDWDENGEMSPTPIENPEEVDARRMQQGLPPLQETLKRIRESVKAERGKPPADLKARREEFLAWAKKVGWRK